MEMLSLVLTLASISLGLLVILAHVRHKYVMANKICVGGVMCVLAAFVVDFVRNAYPLQLLQGFMLVYLAGYLMWKRAYA